MNLFFIYALALISILLPFEVFANPATYPINLGDSVSDTVNLIFNVVASLVSAITGYFFGSKNSKIRLEPEQITYLNLAIQSGLTLARNKALHLAENIDDPRVKSRLVADTVNFVLATVPKAVGSLGFTELKIRDLVLTHVVPVEKGTVANAF